LHEIHFRAVPTLVLFGNEACEAAGCEVYAFHIPLGCDRSTIENWYCEQTFLTH